MIAGKKILLAVTGSIAAYKVVFLVRLLVKSGVEVRVIMTKAAKDFVSPLTFATLSKHSVYSDYFEEETGKWNSHVELGLWADLMIVAPLTANTLAKLANGYCDNLICATYLSARCHVIIAPAMDLDMYRHPTTRANLNKLTAYGNTVVEAEDGELASGLYGTGRMTEPEYLFELIKTHCRLQQTLQGKKVLITSGPTFEALDPVRFIGNHSSGKMGAALANAFVSAGASIKFISGPVNNYPAASEEIEVLKIQSAKDMLSCANIFFDEMDIAVFVAAVSDFAPKEPETRKIKKSDERLRIELVPNPDIALELNKRKVNQFTVGFALETNNEKVNAKEKLKKKNFDMIVLNSLNDNGAGFSHDTNKVSIFDKDNNELSLELKHKTEVARDIVQLVAERVNS